MFRNRIHILLLTILSFSFIADDPKTLFTIKGKYRLFTSDNIGNIYTVVKDEIRKYNPNGELIKIFSSKNLGPIQNIDASNPLRILVHYRDMARILFLDNQLSQNGSVIDLLSLSLEQSDLACTSFNNGVWLFNRQNMELVRLEESLNKTVSTGNLNRLLGVQLKPVAMTEYKGYVYLADPNEGVLVFDIYGTYFKTIPIKNVISIQVIDDYLFCFRTGEFLSYHMKFLDELSVKIPEATSARMGMNRYYIGYADSIIVKDRMK